MALNSSAPFTAFGVNCPTPGCARFASSINATTPLTTPAAMLVPLNLM
jgi:hypothetical protein